MRTKSKKTSETPEHIHATMFIEGTEYFVTKYEDPNEEFANVVGRFRNSNGGTEVKDQMIKKEIIADHCECFHKCEINSQNWMRAYEKAYLKVTSPSGKKLTVYKKHVTNKMDKSTKELIQALAMGDSIRQAMLTSGQMKKLLKEGVTFN